MAYDTKVLLIAIGEIVAKSESKEEIYQAVSDMANAEGVVLKSLEERKKEKEGKN
jgi:hypothetical protein